MRYPKFLKEGGSIGFLAPSFGCTTSPYKEAFDSALAKFEALGHKTVLGPNCYADCGTGISNVPEKCGSEVNKMFASDADILISCGGGELRRPRPRVHDLCRSEGRVVLARPGIDVSELQNVVAHLPAVVYKEESAAVHQAQR